MPLFSFECSECKNVIERYLPKHDDPIEMTCECGNTDFTKLFGKTHQRTYLNARDNLNEKILPDANRIMDNISRGKDRDFLDVCGEK